MSSRTDETVKKALPWVTLVIMVIAIYLVFSPASAIYGPGGVPLGDSFRIFYFHVPLAWIAYLAFFVTAASSFMYLRTRALKWDAFASSSAEIGVIFCGLVLITGPIWAKDAWGVWWAWDPQLTTALILWLSYAAYLMVRSAVPEQERRARLAAVFGIVAFIGVPLSHLSVRIWATLHPAVVRGGQIEGYPVYVLLFNILAFTLLYAYLFSTKVDIERMSEEVRQGLGSGE